MTKPDTSGSLGGVLVSVAPLMVGVGLLQSLVAVTPGAYRRRFAVREGSHT